MIREPSVDSAMPEAVVEEEGGVAEGTEGIVARLAMEGLSVVASGGGGFIYIGFWSFNSQK